MCMPPHSLTRKGRNSVTMNEILWRKKNRQGEIADSLYVLNYSSIKGIGINKNKTAYKDWSFFNKWKEKLVYYFF